ncbi:hypothetical protein VU03_01355, partial [Desulfobulbus sp. N3]|nr:hypothetical protein [Desulfobulbus sp. N3]
QAGTAGKGIAVLFRSGFHSYKLEMELAAHSLEFEKRGGMKLTELPISRMRSPIAGEVGSRRDYPRD